MMFLLVFVFNSFYTQYKLSTKEVVRFLLNFFYNLNMHYNILLIQSFHKW